MILYRALVSSEERLADLGELAESISEASRGIRIERLTPSSFSIFLEGVPASLRASVSLVLLEDVDQAVLTQFGASSRALSFETSRHTPESGGVLWDSLVLALDRFPIVAVWLNAAAYGAEVVARLAPVRSVRFSDGVIGHVLTPTEFNRLLEEPLA